MKSALIDKSTTFVVQVQPLGETFPVDSDHEWVDCPDDLIAYNYTYVNGQFVPYVAPAPPPPTAKQNKETASKLLYATDWTTVADVGDPTKSNPYLSNVQDFIVYRNAVRQIAVNPVSGDIQWPVKPTEVWKSV